MRCSSGTGDQRQRRGRLVVKVAVVVAAVVVGGSVARPSSAIVNGYTATPGSSNFVAQLSITKAGGTMGSCTGSLIHPLWVLTAKHCVITATSATIRIGNQRTNTGGEFRTSRSFYPRGVASNEPGDDIALVRLDRPSYQTPIKLASPGYASRWTTDPATESVYGYATGWGQTTASGTSASTIQRAYVKVAPSRTDAAGTRFIQLKSPNGAGTCFGDSGGPLLLIADNSELREVGVSAKGDCAGQAEYAEVGAGANRDYIRNYIPDIDNPSPAYSYEWWDNYDGPTSRTFSGSPALATRPDGQGNEHVFVRGNDNALWWRMRGESGSWVNEWTSLGGYITSRPAAVVWSTEETFVFARGGDNAMYMRHYYPGTGWKDWEWLNGNLTSGPGVTSWTNGHIDLFARGTNNQLLQKTFENGGWSWWINRGGTLTSDPGVGSWGPGRTDVFVRGTDNRMWQWVYDHGSMNWYQLDGLLGSAPAVASRGANRYDVFAGGTDGRLYHKTFDERGWSPWMARGGYQTAAPAATTRAVSAQVEYVDYAIRGGDGRLWVDRT